MIVDDLLEVEFDGIPNTLNNESISHMKYLLTYTDGELLDVYIRSSKRKSVPEFYNDHYASVIFMKINLSMITNMKHIHLNAIGIM